MISQEALLELPGKRIRGPKSGAPPPKPIFVQLISGARLFSGTGVPPATLGVNGDLFARKDGGGAGATHLYFNNAGAWIGIA